jgi:hypothetical protein
MTNLPRIRDKVGIQHLPYGPLPDFSVPRDCLEHATNVTRHGGAETEVSVSRITELAKEDPDRKFLSIAPLSYT